MKLRQRVFEFHSIPPGSVLRNPLKRQSERPASREEKIARATILFAVIYFGGRIVVGEISREVSAAIERSQKLQHPLDSFKMEAHRAAPFREKDLSPNLRQTTGR